MKYPNNLKKLAKETGWKIRELSQETGIPERTLHYWKSGNGAIPPKERLQLAQLLGCKAQDLAPYSRFVTQEWGETKSMTFSTEEEERKTHLFKVGNSIGTWMALDGDGVSEYILENIRTHYTSQTEELPDDLLLRKNQIEQEQSEKKEQRLPFAWNGKIYNLDRFVIGRDAAHEEITLDLWFSPSDYYTFLATNKSLDNPSIRAKYLKEEPNWYEPIPFFSHSFGIALVVITSDGYCLLTRRSSYQSINPDSYSTAAVVEGLSRPVDRGTTSQAPDFYRCACRGLSEELGLLEKVDFSLKDVLFLNFGVNTQYCTYGMIGMVKVLRSYEEVVAKWGKGVKDKTENKSLFPLLFTPTDYIRFVTEHHMVGESLYYALVHEFGRAEVDKAIASHF